MRNLFHFSNLIFSAGKSRFDFRAEVWQLLKKNISRGQLLGYALANAVGLSVILAGTMFFLDSRNSVSDDTFFSDDYVVVSKKVEGIGFEPVNFSADEIRELRKQPWATKVGVFTASRFAVNASVNMGQRGLSTYLFFESVPDEFFDVKPRDWYFDPAEKFVPVILSKDYLTLYNFGFAIPQGLPQVSEDVIGAVPVTLRITGHENVTDTFSAAIVGFSSRLNTIAVPQSFMDWANKTYSTQGQANPSRLIVKTDQFAAADMKQYLESHGLEIAGDKDGAGNISEFLRVVSGVVATNGLVISLLALFILILSVFLLLQKSKETLRKLMLLGYSPQEVGRYYETLIVCANTAITVVAINVTFCCRTLWSKQLHDIGLGGASMLPVFLMAIAYLLIVTYINVSVIRRKLLAVWH